MSITLRPLIALALLAASLSAAAAPLEIAAIEHAGDVDFEKQILPLFRRNCLACHSATEAQGDLVLESPQTILKGGSTGPAVVPGKGGDSLLVKLASHQKEPFMPPPDNDVKAKNLTPPELGLLKLWIDQGAKGEIKAANAQITWQPLPPGVNPIYAVAITADGQYAAASRANQIFMYHVPSKRKLGRLTDPSLLAGGVYSQPGVADLDLIQSLKFSPDGQLLASGGFRTVKLWRKSVSLKKTATLAFGPADSLTATAAEDGTVHIKETATGKELRSVAHGSPVASLAASSDGKRLVTASASSAAKLWDVDSGKQVAELKGDLRANVKVGQSTRSAALAKKHVELAKKDLEDAKKRKTDEDDNQKKSAEALTKAETDFKPKAEAAKKATDEKAAADKVLATAAATKAQADEAKKQSAAALTKSDEVLKLVSTSLEAAAKIEGDAAKEVKAAAEKAVAELAALKKSLEPGKAAAEKKLAEADAAVAEAEKKQKEVAAVHQKAIDEQTAAQRTLDTAKRGVERAADAVKKATEALPGFEALVKSAEEAAKGRDGELAQAQAAAKESEKPLLSCAFSADGSTVLTSRDDGTIYTWDAATGSPVEVIAGTGVGSLPAPATWTVAVEWKLERTIGSPNDTSAFTDRVTALDFAPDGKTLAAGSGEPSRGGEVKLFDVATGKQTLVLKDPHSDTVNTLAFSPDGTQLASGAADRFVKLWNVADGKIIRAFEGHTHHVLGVAWKPDGRMLVSSGADMVLKIWDARSGDQLRTVQNQFTKEVTSVTFASDDIFVAAGGDSKVRFVNATNGNNQRDFSGAAEYMYSVAASADGKTILAGGLDSTLRLWSDDGKELAKFPPPTSAKSKTASN